MALTPQVELLRSVLISILGILLLLLSIPQHYSYAQESVYPLTIDGKSYDIAYEMPNGNITNIEMGFETGDMTIDLTAPEETKLTLHLPREIIDRLGDIGMLTLFVDGEQSEINEVSLTCDIRTVTVDIPAGAEELLIVGIEPGQGETGATLNVMAENKNFSVDISTSSTVCGLEFFKEEKKLEIPIENGDRMRLSFPIELLGGPYSVYVDDQPVNFTASYFNATRHSTITLEYANAETIEIVGTTAVPEFGSLALVVAASAISAVLLGYRMRPKFM